MSAAEIRSIVEGLLRTLDARAAGCWRAEADRLVQEAFVGAVDLPEEVAREFASATEVVSLDRIELGIVRAAVERAPVVSVAAELPAEVGSGLWLRRFGAARSVAVPLVDVREAIFGVLAVAIPPSATTDDEVVQIIRDHGGRIEPRSDRSP